jgi:hypothetical protein
MMLPFPVLARVSLSAARSPVITFRLVLCAFFGPELPALANASYDSAHNAPSAFIDVEQTSASD